MYYQPPFTLLPRETVWKTLITSQPPYHEASHRDIDKRFSCGAKPLVVLAHPPVLRESREGALHDDIPAREQLLPIDLPALFRSLLRPLHRDLLWHWLGSAMNNLDAQAKHLFHPALTLAPTPVAAQATARNFCAGFVILRQTRFLVQRYAKAIICATPHQPHHRALATY